MNKITLNFINKSNDANNSSVVIFQRNVAEPSVEAVAWTVIENCGPMENHPFTIPDLMHITSQDAYGNYCPKAEARPGDLFVVALTSSGDSGDTLQLSGAADSPEEIHLRNDWDQGAINASIYRDGKLLAYKSGIAFSQKAVFQFNPTIYIGAVSEMEEGQVMDSAIISTINTEISLLGITSADIIMTGGGPGPTATPFEFRLENVKMA